MRIGLINGNGFECDICHELLYPEEVIRIKSIIPKIGSSTGDYITKDTMGVCNKCYESHFSILSGRGLSRERRKNNGKNR